MSMNIKKIAMLLTLLTLVLGIRTVSLCAYAESNSQDIPGKFFEFSEKTNYTFSDESSVVSSEKSIFGSLNVSGSYSFNGSTFTVNKDVLSISYTFNPSNLSADPSEWHIIEDSGEKVDTIDLKGKIKSGAIILQTSLDGEKWVNDTMLTDIFAPDSVLSKPFYTTKAIQQENGCYYRIVVVYKLERTVGSHKTIFGNRNDKEAKKFAEVYTFHVINKDSSNTISAMDTPRKEIGTKVEVEKDKGFSGNIAIDRNDPHFGWDLGVFTINGYTRETKDDKGIPVFLKNLGDKVVLWFTLKQDIDCLNNSGALSIANDDGAYDQHFEIKRTNFGQGTLIIQYTDYQGVKHAPIIYTNYLAANTRTGADTKVQLFEEGDYEVSLDYSIRNNPRQVGPISVIPTYTDYKISFNFSIRNGNCMVFPFDSRTNAELADGAITANGFRLDMAKSRYLTIDVERQTVKENADGTITTDTRFNRPAKDNDTYHDEGIYTFTVKNLYTETAPTTKTIYVGSNKYLAALSKNKITIAELNAKILDGYAVDENGSLLAPAVPETVPSTQSVSESSNSATETQAPAQVLAVSTPATTEEDVNSTVETSEPVSDAPEILSEEVKHSSPAVPIVLIVLFLAIAGFCALKMAHKNATSKKGGNSK